MAGLALGFGLTSTMAVADMSDALLLCANPDLKIAERAEAFSQRGWIESESLDDSIDALASALFLSGVNPGAPETWSAERTKADNVAANLRERRGFDAVHFLGSPDLSGTVTIEPNGSGLATCLYAGRNSDLTPAADYLGIPISATGPGSSARGDIAGGVLIAHAFDPPDGAFETPLRYQSTFTIVLDRTERE